MLILDLWGISFHAVIVFCLGKNVLFKSVLGHCVLILFTIFLAALLENYVMLTPKAMAGEYGKSMNAEVNRITKNIIKLESELAVPTFQGLCSQYAEARCYPKKVPRF